MGWQSNQVSRIAFGAVLSLAVAWAAGCGQPAPPKTPQLTRTSDTESDDPVAYFAVQDDLTPAASTPAFGRTADSGELGQQLYARHCAACHGLQGDGRGIAAAYLFPKPRDFRAGRFRLVSTSNNVPSRDDLHAVLLRGMPGSSMPPWGHLSQIERDALVDELIHLRRQGARESYISFLKDQEQLSDEEIADEGVQQEIQEYVERFTRPAESTVVPEIGKPTPEGLARAKETYTKFGCLQCHGPDGKGDGVQKMVDDEGFPTAPRDFTSGIFKGGDDPASLYRRIAYGMPGTPMPSSKQLTPQQITDVVHYLRLMSTHEQREAAVLNRQKIVVAAARELPTEAGAAAWADVAAVTLRMTPLWWRNNADPDLRIQALHDGKSITVRVSWRDNTPNLDAARSEAFEDAVAMELYRGNEEPFIGMGGPNSPIDVWFWDADRQAVVDVEDKYPNVVVDIYPFSESQARTAEFDRKGTQLANQPEVSLPALATGNQITLGKGATGGSSLAGSGPGSSTFRLPRSQLVSARGKWQEGRWNVLLTRVLATDAADDGISLEPGGKASVAFAVWDGSADDRDGKKLITIWQDLILEE